MLKARKVEGWDAWAILVNDAIVIFDARCPLYWRRYIARRAAEEHGLTTFEIAKVRIRHVSKKG